MGHGFKDCIGLIPFWREMLKRFFVSRWHKNPMMIFLYGVVNLRENFRFVAPTNWVFDHYPITTVDYSVVHYGTFGEIEMLVISLKSILTMRTMGIKRYCGQKH